METRTQLSISLLSSLFELIQYCTVWKMDFRIQGSYFRWSEPDCVWTKNQDDPQNFRQTDPPFMTPIKGLVIGANGIPQDF